ncbi:MAG: exodeoxyribonuclease VII small subunit [Planctomycetes bacterium]|jgi:exodeoxyribonuclease VII small subunit|nr:exodeoxyribonuclease VII small subunit [Planctomycetota bacterium]
MSDKKKKSDELGYAAASGELEQILQDIESGEIDLDVLTDKVERAAALLAICRQKLAATETKVKKVTAELAAAIETPIPTEDDETEA